jgi:hypothetical protein
VNEEICFRAAEIDDWQYDEGSEICISSVEQTCLYLFIVSNSTPDKGIELDCDACEGISVRDRCYGYLATLNNDADKCLEVSDESMQMDCMFYLALRNHNKTLCQDGTNREGKNCEDVFEYIKNLDNPYSGCRNVALDVPELSLLAPECYLVYGLYHARDSFCEMIGTVRQDDPNRPFLGGYLCSLLVK